MIFYWQPKSHFESESINKLNAKCRTLNYEMLLEKLAINPNWTTIKNVLFVYIISINILLNGLCVSILYQNKF